MTWNHRVIRRRFRRKSGSETGYEIREVYYDGKGKPYLYGSSEKAPYGETLDSLRWVLTQMLAATFKPLFRPKDIKQAFTKSNRGG